jgi:hypothetical protein
VIKLENILRGGNTVNERELLTCQDDIEQIILRNETYNICVRRITDNKIEEYYIINFYSTDTNCVILQIDIKNKICHLTELLKQQGCIMKKKSNNKYKDNIKECGEILMEIIIKICEKMKIKEIQLLDNSYKECIKDGNRSRINLITSKMMLDGDTWYGKFGFEPKTDEDKEIYKYNQYNYNIYFTKNMNMNKVIKKIQNKDKLVKEIDIIKKKYEEMKESKLSVYMKWLSNNYCGIYSDVYEYVYRKAGYKNYSSNIFILKI